MPATPCCPQPLESSPFERHETAGTFFSHLFSTGDFPARWYCGTWTAELGWLHIIADVGIFGAYTAIPLAIAYFILRRRDVPFPNILWLFVSFIMACGIGHLVEAGIFWYPAYRLSGLIKAITAIVSWITVFAILRIMPRVLELPQIAALNNQLLAEIEERKRAQAENAKLSLVASKSRNSVIITNAEGQIGWVNEAFTKLTGYAFDEAVGQKPGSLLQGPETDRQTAIRIRDCLKEKKAVSADIVNYSKAGKPYWISLEIEPVFDDAGQFIQFVGTQVDITERKRVDAELRRSNARFEALQDANILGIIIARSDGQIVSANQEFLRMTGYAKAELEAGELNHFNLTPVGTDSAHWQQMPCPEMTDHRLPWRQDYVSKAGTLVPVLIGVTPLPEDGDLRLGFVLDMTHQKAVEEKLKIARLTAEAANAAKSSFLANMSHEIRTPLNAIIGFTELLSSGEIEPREQEEYYKTILTSSHHLLTLINDILDLSKVESGKMEFELEWCSPNAIIRDVASVLRVRAVEKGLKLECRWDGPVPEKLRTDPIRLRQLLTNLVGNAIKFTESGLVRIRASLEVQSEEPRFHIEVQDSGIGIAPENLQKVFDPFTQADAGITRSFGGTGLGLAIVKRIAEGLGGAIHLESQLGRGSVFQVSLPSGPLDQIRLIHSFTGEATRDDRSLVNDQPQLTDDQTLHGKKILVVDDGDTNRRLISLMLRKAGAETECAEHGVHALQILDREDFDLVIMDMQMPILDGYSATRQLRDNGLAIPIIALTAHAMRGDREKCLAAGCTDFLSKPVERQELCRMVCALLQHNASAPTTSSSESSDDQTSFATTSEEVALSGDRISTTLPVDDPDFREIIVQFVDGLPKRFRELDRILAVEDSEESLLSFAHSLKGAAGMTGFPTFANRAKELEFAIKDQNAAKISQLVIDLKFMATQLYVPEPVESCT